MKILVVDDCEQLRGLLTTLFRRQAHDSVEAADGREAIDLLREERFDLVITDVEMPRTKYNGHAVAKAAAERGVPVIVMSGSPADVVERDGVVFLPKPFSPRHLAEAIELVRSAA